MKRSRGRSEALAARGMVLQAAALVLPAAVLVLQAAALVLPAAALVLPAAALPDSGFARDRIDAGFELRELVAMAGQGSDPGPADPEARLRWAIATAIPAAWSERVPVTWSIVENGHLGLSYPDGRTEVSPELLRRSAETVLTTVAHEMGHQVVIALAPGGDGSPPRGFVELLPGNPYVRFDEGWADCVSRVWTGSTQHTTGEPNPCPVDSARYVAVMLSDPENFREKVVPSPLPSPGEPAPPPSRSPPVGPEPPDDRFQPIWALVLVVSGGFVIRKFRKGRKRRAAG